MGLWRGAEIFLNKKSLGFRPSSHTLCALPRRAKIKIGTRPMSPAFADMISKFYKIILLGYGAALKFFKPAHKRRLTKFRGGRMGTRTPDPLIKSQLLYQLSYAPGSDNVQIIYHFFKIASFYRALPGRGG